MRHTPESDRRKKETRVLFYATASSGFVRDLGLLVNEGHILCN